MSKPRISSPPRPIVVVISCCLFGVFVGTALSDEAPAAKSREYKIRLRAADFANKDQRDDLWRMVARKEGGAPVPDEVLEAKKCRRVSYLDTPRRDIKKAERVLRRREKLGDTKCEGSPEGKAEISFKARGSAAEIRPALAEGWAAGAKLEEDRLVGRGSAQATTVLSVSADADEKGELSKIKGVRKLFEGALPNLDPDDAVSASCRSVLERRWELKHVGLPKSVDGPELALWYWDQKGAAVPWLAELSFSVELDDAEAVHAADKVEAFLLRKLADHLAKPGSKTEAVYACQEK